MSERSSIVALGCFALLLSACGSPSRGNGPTPTLELAASSPIETAASSPTAVPCACAPSGEPLSSPTASDSGTTPPGWFSVAYVTPAPQEKPGDANLALTISQARFGTLVAQTAADASCVAGGNFQSGARIATDGLGSKRADATGAVSWTFTAPITERGWTTYTLTCSKGDSLRAARVLFVIN